MRHAWTVAALAAGGLLAAGAAAPAAMAADDCPNAAVRAQQGSTHLPNCMAYERLSPANTNGAPAKPYASTADGSRVLLESLVSLDGSTGNLNGLFTATRPVDGSTDWLVTSLSPSFGGRLPFASDAAKIDGRSEDLTRFALRTAYPLSSNDQGAVTRRGITTSSEDLYLRNADGSFSWIVADPTAVDTSLLPVLFVGGSSDLERVVVSTARQFDPRVTTTDIEHLYTWFDGEMQLATVMPDGSVATTVDRSANRNPRMREVSNDGRRLAFHTTDEGTRRLFVRVNVDDPTSAETLEVAVGPAGQPCTGGGANLLSLSGDGTRVLFQCESALLPGAPANAVYMRDLDGGASALRLVGPAYLGPVFLAGTDDFSLVYMDGVGDDDSLMLIRDGVPQKIATGTQRLGGEQETRNVSMSPNGEYVAFQARFDYGVPGVDIGEPGTDTIYDASRFQVYRYAVRSGELSCVSCQQDGAPTIGNAEFAPTIQYLSGFINRSVVSDDGNVTFTTTTELDSRDSNGRYDAYAWIDGRQVLLSSGRSGLDTLAAGQSADGRSLFLQTADALVPSDRDNGAYSAYAVRVGGGVAVSEDEECSANCLAPAPERPGLPGVGSVAIGAGNLVEETTSRRSSRASASLTVPRSVRGSNVKVRVKVSRAGSIRVSGVGLRQATVTAKKAGTYRVKVRLSANGMKQQRSRGRLATRITARFTPTSGASVTARKSVTFTAKKGGR